jgi:2-(1,2-epoxy-1,2-dihydrophenyl)acetyl-CoA isomerase
MTEEATVPDADAPDEVLYEVDGGVAVITLNRPERLNAFTMTLERGLEARIRRADADPAVRCMVITGAGRGFCAGDDIRDQWSDPEMTEGLERASAAGSMTPLFACLLGVRTPTVAAVNGPAVGIGMDLALFCDVRFAGPRARFSQGYIRMGLAPDIGGTWLLPQLIGRMEATRLLLTGELIDADEAVGIGLALAGGDDVLATTMDFARRVAQSAPLAAAATVDLLRRSAGLGIDDLEPFAADRVRALATLFTTEDHTEAVAAFMERRQPTFRGL